MAKGTRSDEQADESNPPPTKGGTPASESLRASVQLMTTAVGGAAGAVADGFEAFSDELNAESVRNRGLFNGLVEGTIAGQTRFLRSLAETFDRVQEGVRDFESGTRGRAAQEPIDYERLAAAVAAAMRKADAGE
jgi:hypothetical protein